MSGRRAVSLDMGASGPRAREATALSTSLASRGFTFERFSDARTLLENLTGTPADVLIVDADSPWLDLREFVESIRRDPRTARTLIVALASGDPRELPARREIALILAKPINADEAASRLEGLVVTRQKAVTNTRELRGDLSQLPLPDLLQLLSVSRASGTLSVEGTGRRGSLVLDNGDLREVSSGPATGIKAFVRLLQFAEGAFVFTPGTLPPSDRPTEVQALGPVLFEATRQLDEIQRLKPALPGAWVEIRRSRKLVSDEMRQRIRSNPAYADVDRHLDTARTLSALLDASTATDAEILEAVDTFRREGLLDIAGGSAGDQVDVLDAAFASALSARLNETGRVQARVLVIVDEAPGASDAALGRALGGIAGFVPAEATAGSPLVLGSLGTLMIGDARVDLFAVPADRDLGPLWAVFGASAEAAIITGVSRDGGREERILASEVGIPTASVNGAVTTKAVAEALRAALEQLNPRAQS